jgi:hypothetical protein
MSHQSKLQSSDFSAVEAESRETRERDGELRTQSTVENGDGRSGKEDVLEADLSTSLQSEEPRGFLRALLVDLELVVHVVRAQTWNEATKAK